MIKNILTYRLRFLHKALLCLGLFLALGTTATFAQFAVSEDFRGAGNPDIIIGDNAILTSGNGDPVNGGWLRLTPSSSNKKGYAFVDKSFPSTLGVLVDFEYKTWRSTADSYNGADGIGIFLFDGSVTQSTFSLGGYGGSLGYAPNTVAGTTTGLKGGYVGVGLDEYGNFSNNNEGRNGGPGVRPNSVVLRGPTTTNASTTNPYLSGTTITTTDGVNFGYPSSATTGDAAQNALDYNSLPPTRPTDTQFYRRVQIEIERLTTGGQYKITVRWKTTPTGAFTDITTYTTNDIPPALLKLGFAAATGGGWNNHEIRNLLVTTPNNMRVKKTANKDFIRTVAGGSNQNEITYTIEVANDTPDSVYNIDFVDQLTDVNGNPIPKYSASPLTNGFEITSVNAINFTSGTLTTSSSDNKITGTMDMGPNSTAIVTVTGTLRNYTPTGGYLINKATATPPLDNDLNNNTSVVTTPVLVEGIDFATTHSVDANCADGSNTFTINVANIGVVAANIGGSSGKKLRMAITVPSTTGFTYAAVTINGWSQIGGGVVSGSNTIYTYESNQTATVSSGGAYNYPIVYTVTKSGASAPYLTSAVSTYFNTSNSSNAETGSLTNNTALVNVVAKPVKPTATTSIYYCQGDTPSALVATGTGSNALKWYFAASGGFSSDFAPIPQTDVAGIKSFWVTQTNGTCESDRTQINVYVSPTPSAGTIGADQYFCGSGGTAAKLTSITDGSVGSPGFTPTRTYKWQKNTDLINPDWNDISNSNSKEYSPGYVNTTTQYRRVTISTNGSKECQSAASNVITVAIYATPNAGSLSSTYNAVCSGNTFTITSGQDGSVSDGGIISYAWQFSTNGGSTYSGDIAGATGSTYTTGPLTQDTHYRRVTISTHGTNTCRTVATAIQLRVMPLATGGTLASSQTVCSGSAPLQITTQPGNNANGGYVWQLSTDNATWTDISGAPTYDAPYTPQAITVTTYYRRIGSSNEGIICPGTPSNVVKMTVTAPVGGNAGPNQTICNGNAAGNLSVTGAGAGTYLWEYSANASGGPWLTAPGTSNGTTYSPGTLTTTTYFRRVTKGSGCIGDGYSTTVSIIVSVPDGGNINANQNICNGDSPTNLTSVNTGITGSYSWQKSTDAGVSWTDAGGASSSYSFISSNIPATTTSYRRLTTPSSGCIAYSNTVIITVSDIPTKGTIAVKQTICNGDIPELLTSATDGTGTGTITYAWQSKTGPAAWSGDIVGATEATYQPEALTQNTRFRRFTIATNGTAICRSDATNVIMITVSDAVTAGSIDGTQTICMDTAPTVLGSTTVGLGTGSGTITYRWESSPNGSTGWTVISGESANTYQPAALHTTRYYRRTTIATFTANGNTATCESGTTTPITVTTKNCKVITNPMIYQKVKN